MKQFFSIVLLCSLVINTAFSADKNFVVNPQTIQKQMLSKNISLLQALNNVQNSKLNITMARAKLLPSLNLGVLLPALANPTFLLSSVTFLFPFLVPSNWIALKQEKQLFEADKAAYKALQLNILSNSLSLYYAYLNDLKVQSIYKQQSEILKKIYQNLKVQSDILGNVPAEELGMAQAQWDESRIKISKFEELMIEERAALRTLLGLPLGTTLEVENATIAASEFEDKTPGEIAVHSLDVAPEAAQLNYLIKAAQTGKFSKLFGFMSSASIGGSANNGSSPFDSMKAGGNFSFGAENLVNIKIANNHLQSIRLREEQLKQENEKTAEIVIGKIGEVKEQLKLSTSALSNRLKVFEGQKKQYELGLIPLQTLLQTESQLTDIRVNNLKAELDMNVQRLTLLRLVVAGDFSLVKGCQAVSVEGKKGLFGNKKEQTLDQVCP